MEDIKIVKALEDSGLLLKEVTETVQNKLKEQRGGFLSKLLGTWVLLGIRKYFRKLLGSILAVVRKYFSRLKNK